jgi:hypothetical protein
MAYIFRDCRCPVHVPSGFWAREREPTAFALARSVSARQKASHGLDSSVSGLNRLTMSKAIPKECSSLSNTLFVK